MYYNTTLTQEYFAEPHSPDYCTFTIIQANCLPHYSRVVKARMNLDRKKLAKG